MNKGHRKIPSPLVYPVTVIPIFFSHTCVCVYTPTHPLMMCEEILEINLSQIFTLQTSMAF